MPEQVPDTRPGAYYVSVVDYAGPRRRVGYLAGPFVSHQEALARVEEVRCVAVALDPWAHFYGFGTCRMANGERRGSLNDRIGYQPPESGGEE